MPVYIVDKGTDEQVVILANSINEAREKIIHFGVKNGYAKHWRENCDIERVDHDGHHVYKLY